MWQPRILLLLPSCLLITYFRFYNLDILAVLTCRGVSRCMLCLADRLAASEVERLEHADTSQTHAGQNRLVEAWQDKLSHLWFSSPLLDQRNIHVH